MNKWCLLASLLRAGLSRVISGKVSADSAAQAAMTALVILDSSLLKRKRGLVRES